MLLPTFPQSNGACVRAHVDEPHSIVSASRLCPLALVPSPCTICGQSAYISTGCVPRVARLFCRGTHPSALEKPRMSSVCTWGSSCRAGSTEDHLCLTKDTVELTTGSVGLTKDTVVLTKDIVALTKGTVGLTKDTVGLTKDTVGC